MVGPLTLGLLCGLLAATLAEATLSPPAVLSLGPEVIKEQLTQKLEDHNVATILQQLPLLSAMRKRSAGGEIPLLSSLVDTILKYIIWLRVTSASILQLQVQPSTYYQEMLVRVPLNMVAGLNTPLVKTIVEFQMESEAQALVRVERSNSMPSRLVLSECFSSGSSLRIHLLHRLSFLVNPLAKKVMNLLVPALPELVKTELCPVIKAAFDDMYADFLRLARMPIPLSPGGLEFDPLSLAIEENVIQLNLEAKVLDSKGRVTTRFNSSEMTLMVPNLGNTPFSFVVRQDVVNAVVAALLPSEKFVILLFYVLPDVAQELKLSLEKISKQVADRLDNTQIVKMVTQDVPYLHLAPGSTKAAQEIVMDIFATERDLHPLFTLGIEATSEVQFDNNDDRLTLNFNDISSDRIQLMNSDIGIFNPELLKDVITRILTLQLLPNQNSKLRTGIPVSIVKALGYEAASWSVAQDTLMLTPDLDFY
ncbi:PREDICTED: BPI fold-containing family B member 1 [Chinchilla lanigera]|uniref:BPI fold containing family B member 1 n=1 Tax=Chinchilla lanigera TaxID=34839 RepID=A0A8C2W5C4_CHILA|nr:PREDICTED: BPI fold-containing family B member 1 [Chinchilla lanigera]XP_005384903.1 PREDICTED: BPI fold-containing family B member 1 [Chinchilla lanigera]